MALLFALSILCAVALSSSCASREAEHPVICCLGVLLCTALSPALAFVFRVWVLRRLIRDPQNARQYMRVYLISERSLAVVWFTTACLLVFACHWPAVVRCNWNLFELVLLDELLILVPIALPLFLMKVVQYDIEYWARLYAIPNHTRRTDRWRFAWEQSRVYIGIAIVPILLLTTCWDLSRVFLPRLVEGGWEWIVLLLPLVILFAAFPLLLRVMWPTTELPNRSLHSQLLRMAKRAQLSVRNVIVWHAPSHAPNAAVTGVLPWLTYVFLTDELVKQFDDDEIEATFAHELGHIGCHHNVLRMFALLLPAALLGLLVNIGASGVSTVPNAHTNLVAQPGICLFITMFYLVFVFGWFCRQLEHQADVFACRLLMRAQDAVTQDTLAQDTVRATASARYQSVLQKLSAVAQPDRREWLHPSLNQRSRFLTQALANSAFYRRFERRLAAARLLVTSLTLSSFGISVWFTITS